MTDQYKYTCHHFADADLAGTPARIERHNGGTVILEFFEGSRLEIPCAHLVDLNSPSLRGWVCEGFRGIDLLELFEMAHHHYQCIDAALERGDEEDAATHERMANVVERLIGYEQRRLDRLRREAARRAAEARLAFHDHEDTLDLY